MTTQGAGFNAQQTDADFDKDGKRITVLVSEFDPEQEVYLVTLKVSSKRGGRCYEGTAAITGPHRVFHVGVASVLLPPNTEAGQPLAVYTQENWLYAFPGGNALVKALPGLAAKKPGVEIPPPDVSWASNKRPRQKLAASREAAEQLAEEMLAAFLVNATENGTTAGE